MRLALRIAIAVALLAAPVMAQGERDSTVLQRQRPVESVTQDTTDAPPGWPYRTGDNPSRGSEGGSVNLTQAQVPLRDYLSSRIDNLRGEMLDKLESLERQQTKTQDERDRQYSQRFSAQQDAVQAQLQSYKEATTKAEGDLNKRFESVNEFRQTLDDQQDKFVTKDTVNAQFSGIIAAIKTLEDKTQNNSARLDAIASNADGAASLWGYLVGAVGLILAVVAFAFNASRQHRPVLK